MLGLLRRCLAGWTALAAFRHCPDYCHWLLKESMVPLRIGRSRDIADHAYVCVMLDQYRDGISKALQPVRSSSCLDPDRKTDWWNRSTLTFVSSF